MSFRVDHAPYHKKYVHLSALKIEHDKVCGDSVNMVEGLPR